MPNSQLHTAISSPRFNRYLKACTNDQKRAEDLYKANLLLSQEMYAVIGIFEIVLRNSIDRHFKPIKGHSWLSDAVQSGGYLETSPGCEESVKSVRDAIAKLGTNCTHDRLIAKLTFGFWAYQFAAKQYAAGGSSLLNIFSDRPHGTNQKAVFQRLIKINQIRNRVAHYEPICFDPNGAISTGRCQRRYYLIVEMLTWLGCSPAHILDGVDGVQRAIDHLNAV
jgi:hypothetical protein